MPFKTAPPLYAKQWVYGYWEASVTVYYCKECGTVTWLIDEDKQIDDKRSRRLSSSAKKKITY